MILVLGGGFIDGGSVLDVSGWGDLMLFRIAIVSVD